MKKQNEIPTITLTAADEDWLKTLDGGSYKRADLAAHAEAERMMRNEEFATGLAALTRVGKKSE
jgi:hypothetical protein